MFARFTDRARTTMALANQEAQRFKHEYIAPEHILLGLVAEGSGIGANVLKNMGIDLPRLRAEVAKLPEVGTQEATQRKAPPTLRATKVLERAMSESQRLDHNYVGTEHLLLGLLGERDGVVAAVFAGLGVEPDRIRHELLDVLGVSVWDAPSGGDATEGDRIRDGELFVQENPAGSLRGPDRQSLFGDSKLLRLFLLDRDAACPRCGYNLRNLTEPRCPECAEALTLKVSAQRPIFGLFWVTILPGILSCVCAIVLLVLLQFDPQVPPAVWWVDLFGFASGASVAVLFIYRRAFSRRSEQAQLTVAVIIWLVHVVVFLVLARTY